MWSCGWPELDILHSSGSFLLFWNEKYCVSYLLSPCLVSILSFYLFFRTCFRPIYFISFWCFRVPVTHKHNSFFLIDSENGWVVCTSLRQDVVQGQRSSATWGYVNAWVVALNLCKFNEWALEQCDLSLVEGHYCCSLAFTFRRSFLSVITAYYLGRHLYCLFFKGCFKTHFLKVIVQGRNATFQLPVKMCIIYTRSDKKHHWVSNIYRLLFRKRKWTPVFSVMVLDIH